MPNELARDRTYGKVLDEVLQSHPVRSDLYKKLEDALGEETRVISLFTSFIFPVLLQDPDADMLEEILQNSDLSGKKLNITPKFTWRGGAASRKDCEYL